MANQSMKRLLQNIDDVGIKLLKKHESYQRIVYNVLSSRYQSQWSNSKATETDYVSNEATNVTKNAEYGSKLSRYSSDEEDFGYNKWKLELAWLTKAIDPALQLCRKALPTGNGFGNKIPPSSRSLTEIVASIQWSKLGLQDWSLSDLTIGLYLIYLRQASTNAFEDVKGVQISSESIVQDLIYHTELAKGAYKDNAASLARNSMLRERNIVKFIKNSSVLRPGYYIAVDTRKKLVILGIRGTHTVYDLITNIASSGSEEVTFEGYSTHFGTAEGARWFLNHEMGTIKKCLERHEGFRVRLVGHSLGGSIASLLAIMLRKKSFKELGFNPDIVSAVGFATPPSVSRELAENCSHCVTTLVMQDDIIPRLSVASLTRLRNEILQADWTTVFEKEDWRSVIDLVTNAKQVVSSVQDVARKFTDYAKFTSETKISDAPIRKESPVVSSVPGSATFSITSDVLVRKEEAACTMPEELLVPGTLYYLKRRVDTHSGNSNSKAGEFFTLWKRHPGEHFQRILLSGNIISDHKCDSHYYALRDVLKDLPSSCDEGIL